MDLIQSREREHKLIQNTITGIYQTLHEDDGFLIPPSKEHGIFKYTGTTPKTQGVLTKIAKKRENNRPGLGFVIRRADFPDHVRLSVDVEASTAVSGHEPYEVYQTVLTYMDTEYPMMLPPIITYSQPAYSGRRGWDSKTFIGFEVELEDKDFENLNKTQKRLLDYIRKLFYALDYALTQ